VCARSLAWKEYYGEHKDEILARRKKREAAAAAADSQQVPSAAAATHGQAAAAAQPTATVPIRAAAAPGATAGAVKLASAAPGTVASGGRGRGRCAAHGEQPLPAEPADGPQRGKRARTGGQPPAAQDQGAAGRPAVATAPAAADGAPLDAEASDGGGGGRRATPGEQAVPAEAADEAYGVLGEAACCEPGALARAMPAPLANRASGKAWLLWCLESALAIVRHSTEAELASCPGASDCAGYMPD